MQLLVSRDYPVIDRLSDDGRIHRTRTAFLNDRRRIPAAQVIGREA
jgi:hypothetical protein